MSKDMNKENNKQLYLIEFGNIVSEIPYLETKTLKETSRLKQYILANKYRIQFFISFAIAIIFIFIFYYNIYNYNKQEALSKNLLNNYTLTTLYQNKNVTSEAKQVVLTKDPFVIGMIKISKINVNYPILSESNSDLLKISLCRFAGPLPNENGNLCIAGHNYVDNKFFSRLADLNKNDLIDIYDLSGRMVSYYVFDKYEVKADDLSCTEQNVGENKIITLLTCNNVNGKRTVVKAKEVITQ